jgi:diguanylate cyclase
MTINIIVKKAIERLTKEGKLLTPDFYAEAFCKEAKAAGMIVDDCEHVEKYIKTLNTNLQEELKQYHLKTSQELVRYLISKLNRNNASKFAEMNDALAMLLKRVLDAVTLLHDKDALKLAKKTRELLKSNDTSLPQFEKQRQAWVDFITGYNDTFLERLAPFGKVKRDDLRATIENLDVELINKDDLGMVVDLLTASLVPSIAITGNGQIDTISRALQENPELLTAQSMQEEIKSVIQMRIALDKNSFKEMFRALDDIVEKLSIQLIDVIEKSDQSNADIKTIKQELEHYDDESDLDFQTMHKKLYKIATALEESVTTLNDSVKIQNTQVESLSEKIEKLEEELKEAKEASREDFLTKVYNKRGLDEFFRIKENEFDRYERNYSIVIFDLDHFKKVNDTYGHDAGDTILTAFAHILKEGTRAVDIVGRFGGEEFVAILSETDLKGAIKFAQKVCKHTWGAKFLYKDVRIEISVSAGVAERAKFNSLKGTLNSADEQLYHAKRMGRNRVEPEIS